MLFASVAQPTAAVIRSEALNSIIIGLLQNKPPYSPSQVWRELRRCGVDTSRSRVLHRLEMMVVLKLISREYVKQENGVLKLYKPLDLKND